MEGLRFPSVKFALEGLTVAGLIANELMLSLRYGELFSSIIEKYKTYSRSTSTGMRVLLLALCTKSQCE